MQLMIGALLLLSVGVGLWLLYIYIQGSKPSTDPSLDRVFKKVSEVKSYSQYVETEAIFPDRTLKILGTYNVDSAKNAFASYSTTTLLINGDPVQHIFTHQNLALGDDVYMKIETQDPLLKASIKSNPQWQRFSADTIPPSLNSIAVPGPIQDNIEILGEGGSWIYLVKKWGTEDWNGTSLLRYTFRLSGKKPPGHAPVGGLLSRIGAGTIDVWIDPQTFEPRYLRFANSNYISTTTISNINIPQALEAPVTP